MKKFKTVIHVLSWVLSSFIFLLAIALVIAFSVGFRIFCIQTGSMEPNYPVGAMIFVKPFEFDALSVGDVITFYSDADKKTVVVTHRVVSIDKDTQEIETKGDNNDTADFSPTLYSDVIGRVEYMIPYAGYPVLFVQTTAGKIITINAFLLVFLAGAVVRYFFDDDEEE